MYDGLGGVFQITFVLAIVGLVALAIGGFAGLWWLIAHVSISIL